ncbi:2-oxo acid dehydrogenase subunit E2 [Rouxiella badensis]|jgi:pyruvate/2-oxoglutarate dehydrogenase complex dihydrolipoamide acyltransferase (E2) component|uniref:2-oxoacid dehydrogenase acyltransferase catalytic domain-containing protein n=1 Tax=Rouxiella badensis TaxID=1646377 RepID=A0A1X0WHB0_9GAMM|nr:2-oxo acid dehydrogenase subunit E2 [Rouxiella badensis]MCC3704998.1 2-oxo acid dehydrogenase subunit E2 [Rouxiella badensis]MCC3721456.1 2-oxo acid dehydrogenase subunit E2 [Rouxiella badensis]MCC3731021.1 2-oxo acid dehydrogenase subunit E2 [Rouxiella badensis]MCC3735238.1 2-oxo acid dehydrogenase subunit E2 [Rouxiella badensis]MCC3742332.1 2-oxo acid dehydrogenase subunit E2 [Rouxiella badensis]
MSHTQQPFPKQRQHTLLFLEQSHAYRPVSIDTDVEMTEVVRHRQQSGKRYSYLAYFIQAMAQVVAEYPAANSMLIGQLFPRLVTLGEVNAKFTLDKTVDEQRVVASAVVEGADQLSLTAIQARIDYFKTQEIASAEVFAPIRKIQKAPLLLGRLLFRLAMRRPEVKSRVQGSFTVTSLGGRAVTRFVPLPGSTLTLGVGDITERAWVKNSQLTVAHATTLTLVFDHRILDGAVSAEILSKIKNKLEKFAFDNNENVAQLPAA